MGIRSLMVISCMNLRPSWGGIMGGSGRRWPRGGIGFGIMIIGRILIGRMPCCASEGSRTNGNSGIVKGWVVQDYILMRESSPAAPERRKCQSPKVPAPCPRHHTTKRAYPSETVFDNQPPTGHPPRPQTATLPPAIDLSQDQRSDATGTSSHRPIPPVPPSIQLDIRGTE